MACYREGVEQYLTYCARVGADPDLHPNTVAAFTSSVLDAGNSPSTARLRQLAVRLFSAWLAAEDEIARDELLGVKPPKLDQQLVVGLDDDEVTALLKACSGKSLGDRRDAAIVRLCLETGVRIGEVVAMTTADVDLARGLATVRRGKGGKARTVAFGPATGSAIDRYIRARRRHVLADRPALWLGEKGYGYSYEAAYRSLGRRAAAAGIAGFHPHRLRHAFASRWLAAGGSEQGLMVTAGWTRREMLDRYSRDTSAKRAHEEARRLNLGDL
ncbi:MAG: tyrosine-type recombinase/integrase [Pseudonocardiaceae bacterium]|nr:tyrosine-type recombinase/integrase [Pseudonocardiaceae bacterium]